MTTVGGAGAYTGAKTSSLGLNVNKLKVTDGEGRGGVFLWEAWSLPKNSRDERRVVVTRGRKD